MAINPATYVKNVGKSFGYAAIEAVSSRNQFLSDTKENMDSIKDLYSEIKDFASSPMDKIKNNQKLMSYSSDLKDGYKNLISDIKTGNLYNKSRSDEVFSKALGLDFDFDSMFDDIDLDADLKDLESTTATTITDSTDREIVAMDTVGSAVATAVSSATARSAEYIVGANAESTRMLMEQNRHLFNTVSTGLIGVNKTLGEIHKLSQPLTDHMKNSVTFYTKSTENQEKMIKLLEQIADQTKPPEVKKTSGRSADNGISNFITSGGSLNISGMKSMLKKNAKNAYESSMLGMILGMSDMMGDGSNVGLKMITSNPIGFMLPMMFSGLMNNSKLGKSMDDLANALSMFNRKTIQALSRQKSNANPFLAFIGELFNYDRGGNFKYRTDNYEKGAVPFDGITRKSIIEVIPNYLSMILSALTGTEQKHYDYDQGKFVTVSDIKKIMDKEVAMEASRSSYDVIRKMKEEKITNKTFEDAVSEYSRKVVENESAEIADYNMAEVMNDTKNYKKYGFATEHKMKVFLRVFSKKENKFYLDQLNANLEANRYNRNSRNREFSVVNNIYNNSGVEGTIQNVVNRYSGRQSKTKAGSKSGSGGTSEEAASEPPSDMGQWIKELVDAGVPEKTAERLVKDYFKNINDTTKAENIYEKIEREKNKAEAKSGKGNKGKVDTREYVNSLVKLLSRPIDFISDQLDKASNKLMEIMYGKDDNDNRGMLGRIFDNIDKMFTDFRDYMKNKFLDPIKKAIEDRGGFKNMIFDMLGISQERVNEIKSGVKSKLRTAGNWVVDNNPFVKAYRNRKGQGSGLLRGGASEMEGESSFADKTAHEVKNAIVSFLSHIFPDKEKFAQDNKIVSGFLKNTISKVAKDPSGAIAGGLIGGGVSLLTGGIIGPLMGASLGAAAGITLNSEKVQTMLFGEEVVDNQDNKTGERSGTGVLSKELTKFLTQDLKNIAGFGISGAALAMLPGVPGGPVAGLILGSAVGFANRNDALSNYLFGEKDENGERLNTGLISKETQDWIKRMAPKGAAGAIIGALAGPFGFVPNIMLGTAIGFASETDKFKDFMFGKEVDGKREGGITGMIRDKIISPIAEAINPIASEIKYRGKKLIRSFGDKLANVFKVHVGIPLWNKLDKYIMGPLGKVFGSVAKSILNVVSLPFQAIGGIGKRLKNRQVQQGRADYMSAEERIAYRSTEAYQKWNKKHIFTKGDEYAQFDEYLRDNPQDLEQLTKDAETARKEIRRLENTGNKNINNIIKLILKYDWSAAKKFNRDFKKNKNYSLAELGVILNSVTEMPQAEKKLAKRYFSQYLESKRGYEKSTGAYGKALEGLSKKLGIKVTTKNIAHIQDMANSQLRHNKANEAKNNAEDAIAENAEKATISIDTKVTSIVDYLKDLLNTVKGYSKNGTGPKFTGTKENWNEFQKAYGKEASAKWQEAKAKANAEKAQGSRLHTWLRGAGSQFSLFGSVKTKIAKDGQEVIDSSDKDSRATIKLRDKVFGEFETISEYVKGIFKKMPTDEDKEEEKEEKKGFLQSIIEGLTGEDGLLGGLLSWFTGTKVGSFLTGLMGKIPPASVAIPGLIGVGIAGSGILALTGKFDELAAKLGLADKSNTLGVGTDAEGNAKVVDHVDEQGRSYDAQGNLLTDISYEAGQGKFSTKMAANTARSLITGTGVIRTGARMADKAFLKGAGGRTVAKAVTSVAEKGMLASVLNLLRDQLENVALKLMDIPKLKGLGEAIAGLTDDMFESASKSAAKHSAKALSKEFLSTALFVAKIALIAWDFEEGCNHAQRTLGIKNPTTGQKILSGLIRVFKNLIPVIGTLIPDRTLVNIFVKYLAPAFGMDITEFLKAQTDLQSEVDQYNAENGTELSIEEYIQTIGRQEGWGEQTWGEGIVGGVKTGWEKFKNDTKQQWAFIKQGGKAIARGAVNLKDKALGAWNYTKEGIGYLMNDIKNSKVVTGTKEIAGLLKRAGSDAIGVIKDGDITKWYLYGSNNYKSSLEKSAYGETVASIIDSAKSVMLPFVGASYVVHVVGGKVKEAIDDAKIAFQNIGTGISDVYHLGMAGDPYAMWNYQGTDVADGTPLGGFYKVIFGIEKFVFTVPSMLTWAGNTLSQNIRDLIEKAKAPLQNIGNGMAELQALEDAGDPYAIWNYQATDVADGTPLGGFYKAIFGIDKAFHLPGAMLKWAGNTISDGITKQISVEKEQISNFRENMAKMKQFSEEGDIVKIWELDTSRANKTDKSLTGGITEFISNVAKGLYTLSGFMNYLGGEIQDTAVWKAFQTLTGAPITQTNENAGIRTQSSTSSNTANTAFTTHANPNANLNNAVNIYQHGSETWSYGKGAFVSQVDPSLAGRSFGNSTFGMNGCAPSVASMLTGLPVNSTAGYATRGGYANQYGTSADYFGNVFSAAGIPSEYVYTGAGSAQDYLAGKIASGHPTVLLGQDPYNTSKAYSPFGPGNHYVLATGMTRNGGVVVQDPESRYPNQVYDSSILNSVKLGIPTGGRSGLSRVRNKIRRLRGGFFYTANGQQSSVNPVGEMESNLPMTTENCYSENLGLFSMPSVDEMNAWIESKAPNDSPFRGQGQVFLDAATASGLDPRYILAHAAVESAWGRSNFAVNRGNYFGIGAFDSNPGNAYTMGSNIRTGIVEGAKWIAKHYYHGKYGQTSVYKMRYNNNVHQYCTSTTWVDSIGKIMASAPRNTKLTLVDGVYSTINGSVMSPTSGSSAGTSAGTSSSSSSGGLLTFGSLFGKLVAAKFGKLGALFGLSSGDESTGTSGSYGTSGEYGTSGSYGVGSNEVYEGLANYDQSSPAGKAQADIVNKMYSVKDKLHYSQQTRNPEAGAADCSSTVNWAYNKILGQTIGSTSLDMFNNDSNMVTVDSALGSMNKSGYSQTSPGPNMNNLQPGDILLYSRSGNTRPYGVGHVSMYIGNGKLLSHGGPDMGPKERDVMSARSNTYLVAKRYRGFADGSYNEEHGYSSNIVYNGTQGKNYGNSMVNERGVKLYSNALVGSGSGLRYNIAQDAMNAIGRKHRSANSVFGKGSRLVNMSKMSTASKAKFMSETIRSLRASGSAIDNNEVMVALIKSVISLLTNVSANSEYMKVMAEKLNEVAGKMSDGGNTNINLSTTGNGLGIQDTDSTLAELSKLLDTFAAGETFGLA